MGDEAVMGEGPDVAINGAYEKRRETVLGEEPDVAINGAYVGGQRDVVRPPPTEVNAFPTWATRFPRG